jgi:hypothetical protein
MDIPLAPKAIAWLQIKQKGWARLPENYNIVANIVKEFIEQFG